MKHIFRSLLTLLIPMLANAQSLGPCTSQDLSFKDLFIACKFVAQDGRYSAEQQALAAIRAGQFNAMTNGSASMSLGMYVLAIEKGNLSGYSHIGNMYKNGTGGTSKDYQKALDYYYLDTSNSSTKAKGLADLHLNGLGVKQNTAKAIGLFWVSITQRKDSVTASQICEAYSDEKYNYLDLVKAHMWCSVSIKLEESIVFKSVFEEKRMAIAQKLTRTQLQESNELLSRCMSRDFLFYCEIPKEY